MTSSSLTILDVGHGNCAVLRSNGCFVVIDAATSGTLLAFLNQNRCEEVEAVFISHADKDHLSGLVGLLANGQIRVRRVYVNPDQVRATLLWKRVLRALSVARRLARTQIVTSLTSDSPGNVDCGTTRLDVLWPVPEMVLRGPGKGTESRSVSANTLSAVLRVVAMDTGQALLAGDIDTLALDELLDESPAIDARVLVFPHHGGWPGTSNGFEFARRLCEVVRPEVVLFSIGRGQFGTPQPSVVAGVRAGAPNAHIACTQLSVRCSPDDQLVEPGHLTAVPALGRRAKACCAGSFELTLPEGSYEPAVAAHREYIAQNVASPLCMRDTVPI